MLGCVSGSSVFNVRFCVLGLGVFMTLCICLILLCIWVCAGASLCVCACLCVCVSLSYCEREAHTERSPLLSSQSPPWEGPGAPRRDCWLCSCRCAAANFLMQGGGAKRGSGGKGRVTLLITTETAGPWSPNSQRGLREAVHAHGSEPGHVFPSCWGSQFRASACRPAPLS